MSVLILFSVCPLVMAEDDSVKVYITVSDITDYTQPINILVPRREITVSNFNLADFGDTMTGIECVEGITYLHALTQLHRELYGDNLVSQNLLLTTDGVTKIFMGNSVANVMYKNGKDIFSLPQLVNIVDGDEIQVCLYDEGHSQAIATFREARIDNVSPGENVELTLQRHYGFPRDRDAIYGAEITDENGIYYTDEYGNIITTGENGDFTINFSDVGTHTISAMPTINYYMSDTGGGIKIEWVPQIVKKEIECITYTKNSNTDPTGKALYNAVFGDEKDNTIILFDWNENRHTEPFMIISKDIETAEKTVIGYEEVTELVKVETVVPDNLEPMITYTTPLVVVNVTDDLILEDVYLIGNNLKVVTKNSEYNSNHDLYIAGYSVNDDGSETLKEVKFFNTINSTNTAIFSSAYDKYKIFAWKDDTMIPLIDSYTYNPDEAVTTMSLDYDYTLPIPENTYITSK